MLLRMPLNTRVSDYGFYQALVATAVVTAWCVRHYLLSSPPCVFAYLCKAFTGGSLAAFISTASVNQIQFLSQHVTQVDLPGFRIVAESQYQPPCILDSILEGLRITE